MGSFLVPLPVTAHERSLAKIEIVDFNFVIGDAKHLRSS